MRPAATKEKVRVMARIDLPKLFFILSISAVVLAVTFLFGIASGFQRGPAFQFVQGLMVSVTNWDVLTGKHPTHHLQPARHAGSGVTVNEVPGSEYNLLLLSGFFDDGNEIRLLTRGGTIVARWPVRFSEIFPDAGHLPRPPSTDWNVDLHGAIAMPDGSVVFNFENAGLARIGLCGDLRWTLERATHHSVELASGGGFWVPGRKHFVSGTSPYPPFELPFTEDMILRVSPDGEVIEEISIAEAMRDSGLLSLLTSTGSPLPEPMHGFHDNGINKELFHLNDIEELSANMAADFPQFGAGDLLLSLRDRNLILVLDVESRRIKWWRIGPWIRQHDPDFLSGGKIMVFNNNRDGTPLGEYYGGSEIIQIDPASNKYNVVYGNEPEEKMHTNIRGKQQALPGGQILITEHEAGRVFQVDTPSGRVVWEYINRYENDEVAEVTEARAYPSSYFDVTDWSCEANNDQIDN